MKTKSFLLLLTLFSYFSCSNDADDIIPGTPQDIQSSVFVTIKDPAGIPVAGALITLGNLTGTTDETGTYFFTRAMLSGDDYLKVSKAGYFNGSRRFFHERLSNTISKNHAITSGGGCELYKFAWGILVHRLKIKIDIPQ